MYLTQITLLVALTMLAGVAFPQAPPASRQEALSGLQSPDAPTRAAAVAWIARNGRAGDDAPLYARLRDEHPTVRNFAEQALWLVWSRSGDAAIDRLMELGVDQMNSARQVEAIATFSEVIRRKPAFAEGWNKRATALYLAGQYQRSLADCDEVLKRNPRHFGALSGAGLDTMPLIMGEIILTGVHDRFPRLKFVSVEAGIGWIPYYAEQMDDRYDRNKYWAKIRLERKPSEYIPTNWWFTFIIDHYGVKNRHAIGIGNVMWSTDYPHHGCDWPHSRKVVAEMFGDVPAAERRQITYDNCARLYNLT